MNRRTAMAGLGAAALVGAAGFWAGLGGKRPSTTDASGGSPSVRLVKSPYCGCCSAWADYLRARGWTVSAENAGNLAAVRRAAGVPEAMAGCHTAFVDGYVVEGHVPAAAIEKLIAERPDLDGIAVPGMPADSPGMGGGGAQDVQGFKGGAGTGLFVRTV